jgi:hypothetical protein
VFSQKSWNRVELRNKTRLAVAKILRVNGWGLAGLRTGRPTQTAKERLGRPQEEQGKLYQNEKNQRKFEGKKAGWKP